MKRYPIPLVPGPTTVAPETLAAYGHDYGSSDLEPEFHELYRETSRLLGEIMTTKNDVVIALGEAMVVLWGTVKSTLRAGRPPPGRSPAASSGRGSPRWPARSGPRRASSSSPGIRCPIPTGSPPPPASMGRPS